MILYSSNIYTSISKYSKYNYLYKGKSNLTLLMCSNTIVPKPKKTSNIH